jgi:hypothetical protein
MYGEPTDVDGECNARLFIADNYGDNSATIRCKLAPDHEGLHQKQFDRAGGPVTITWAADERERCDHGCGQWKDDHGSETVQCPKDADDHEYSECAFCHDGDPAKTCAACGKAYYYEAGHKRRCPNEPFECAACGQSGLGVHTCPTPVEAGTDEDPFKAEPV